jgi:hypothetical protein
MFSFNLSLVGVRVRRLFSKWLMEVRGLYAGDQELGWINLLVKSHDQEKIKIHF